MAKKIKISKIAAVAFLTVLVWVWADLAKMEQYTVSGAKVTVARNPDSSLWISFDDEPLVSIEKIVLKGSASRVADARREMENGTLDFDFTLDPEQEESLAKQGEYLWDVQAFLKRSNRIIQRGLTVVSCEPNQVDIRVVKLIKQPLTVKCVDKDDNPVKTMFIEPSEVLMFVPSGWEREKLTAKVQLTVAEITHARFSTVNKEPYVELAPQQIRKAQTTVKIKMPPEEDLKSDASVTAVKLRFALSPIIQGKYEIEVDNSNAVWGAIAIRATPEAKRAYEDMKYQVILEIDDEDAKSEAPRRELVYNFPAEYVARGEIELNQQPVMARFKLTALTTEPEKGSGD